MCGEGRVEEALARPRPGFPDTSRSSSRFLGTEEGSKAKDESQGGSAGTCSTHSLSPGAALHGTGVEPWQHRREGQPSSWPHPCASLMAFHRLGSDSWAPPTDLGPLLHSQLPVLVHMPSSQRQMSIRITGVSVLFPTPLPFLEVLCLPCLFGRLLLFSHVSPPLRSLT